MRIFIVGVSGFLGSALARHWINEGHRVAGSYFHRTPSFDGLDYSIWRPLGLLCASDMHSAEVVVHCAWDWHSARNSVVGTSRDVREAAIGRKRQILISSYAARAAAGSRYGRAKHMLEKICRDRATIVRPGLVLGGGTLLAQIERTSHWPVVPAVMADEPVLAVIGLGNLLQAMSLILVGGARRIYNLFEPGLITPRELLARLKGSPPHVIDVPYWL